MSASVADLLRAEGTKLARLPATWTLALILVAYLGVIAVTFAAILRAPTIEGFDREAFVAPMRAQPIDFTISLFAGTANILIVILAALLIGHEHSKATLRTMLLAGATRRAFVVAKLATLLLVAALMALLGTAFALGALRLFELALSEDLADPSLANAGWSAMALFTSFGAWAILAATATLWRGSLAMGVGSTMALLIVGDVLTGLLASAGDVGLLAGRLLPNLALARLHGALPPPAGAWLWILPNLAFYLGVLPWLATRRFERADIVALTRR